MAPGYGRAGKGYYTSARGYRSYYTGKFGSSVVGKAVGNAKAQRAGVKNNYFQTTVENVGVSIPFAANAANSSVYGITPGLAHNTKDSTGVVGFNSPLNDKQFRAMCHMFDQIKIIGMKVQLQITPCGANASAVVAPCTVSTLWNRSATVNEVYAPSNTGPTSAMSAADIEGCGSTQVSSLGGYSRYTVKRSIYCRDLQEKANWFDTNIMYWSTVGQSPLTQMAFTAWNGGSWVAPYPRDIHFFFPCLYFYLKRGITTPAETWYMTSRVTYMCVFRNTVNRLDSFCVLNAPNYVNPAGRDLTELYTSKTLPPPDKFTLSFSERDPMPPVATIVDDDDDDDKSEELTEAVKKEAESTSMEDDPGTM